MFTLLLGMFDSSTLNAQSSGSAALVVRIQGFIIAFMLFLVLFE
jgi:hypothetical protein